jgi:hypothetical protein
VPGVDRVLLVPGFFGFGSFGRPEGPRIVYFDHVVRALERARPDLRGRIHVHEPPPMGSLEARVRSLHDALLQILGETMLRGETARRSRIHIVGHSTGGVDARLVANPHFRFKGEDASIRRRLLSHLGTIVTLSAPHHGTPIAATRVRGLYRLVVDGMSFATILAAAGKLRRKVGVPGSKLLVSYLQSSPWRLKVNSTALALAAGIDEETARQIVRFRGLVLSDTGLLRDLEPAHMAALNERISGDHEERLVQIATVAPPPRFDASIIDAVARRAAYALCWHGAASGSFRPTRFPDAKAWIAARSPFEARRDAGDSPRANDGVVPVSSQTLYGRAARLVFADHLDVIGHFESRRNTTLFKSGADFGHREFTALWRFVAEAL